MSAPLQLLVYASPTHTMVDGRNTFSPTTSTLIYGDSEALLVDTQFVDADIDAVGDMIESTGRTLRTVFVTHAHADHYLGAGRLLDRFPGARALSLPSVAAAIEATHATQIELSQSLLGDLVTSARSLPEAMDTDVLYVDGHPLHAIDVGQGDIAPSAIVHVPVLDAVIAGDVAYNGIHAMLAYSSPAEWQSWVASLDTIERLTPAIVVAGHKRSDAPDDDVATIIGGTRDYIRDFTRAAETADSARDVVATMQQRYPQHGNLTTLIASAAAATRAKHEVRQ